MKAHRAVLLSGMLGLLVVAALAPAGGCNGTGVTPMCAYPDGANDPEAGCGVLVEASLEDSPQAGDVVEEPSPNPPGDAGGGGQDADATSPPPADSGNQDGTLDADKDADKDAEKDAPEDVKDSSADHKG